MCFGMHYRTFVVISLNALKGNQKEKRNRDFRWYEIDSRILQNSLLKNNI